MLQSTLDIELIWEHTPFDGNKFYCLEKKTERCVGHIERFGDFLCMYLTYKGCIGSAPNFEIAVELIHTLGSVEWRQQHSR